MIKNVLLVDDDRAMLLALQEGFARYSDSFSVLLAGDGIEALEYLKRQPVSLVVTDLKMPRVDGFELLATIMANFPDIPVIIITGYSTPEMERLARKGGAVAFVAKPFLIENLARQIVSMLRQEADGGTLAQRHLRGVPAVNRDGAEDLHHSAGGKNVRGKGGPLLRGGRVVRCPRGRAPGGNCRL